MSLMLRLSPVRIGPARVVGAPRDVIAPCPGEIARAATHGVHVLLSLELLS